MRCGVLLHRMGGGVLQGWGGLLQGRWRVVAGDAESCCTEVLQGMWSVVARGGGMIDAE